MMEWKRTDSGMDQKWETGIDTGTGTGERDLSWRRKRPSGDWPYRQSRIVVEGREIRPTNEHDEFHPHTSGVESPWVVR
jgi:hypothetical protein